MKALARTPREAARPAPRYDAAGLNHVLDILEASTPPKLVAPTVISDVTLDMPVMAEETFEPVAAVIAVDDDQAAAVANAPVTAWPPACGAPIRTALALGRRITWGALFVHAVVSSDPRLPFGGTKHSGYGRELGLAGATEFTNIRTYVVGTGPPSSGPATE